LLSVLSYLLLLLSPPVSLSFSKFSFQPCEK
jgi:hypothetical protein